MREIAIARHHFPKQRHYQREDIVLGQSQDGKLFKTILRNVASLNNGLKGWHKDKEFSWKNSQDQNCKGSKDENNVANTLIDDNTEIKRKFSNTNCCIVWKALEDVGFLSEIIFVIVKKTWDLNVSLRFYKRRVVKCKRL